MHMHFNQLLLGHRYQKIAWQLKLTTEKLNKSLEPPQSPGVVANGTTVPSVNKLALEELVGIVNFHLLPLTPTHSLNGSVSTRYRAGGIERQRPGGHSKEAYTPLPVAGLCSRPHIAERAGRSQRRCQNPEQYN